MSEENGSGPKPVSEGRSNEHFDGMAESRSDGGDSEGSFEVHSDGTFDEIRTEVYFEPPTEPCGTGMEDAVPYGCGNSHEPFSEMEILGSTVVRKTDVRNIANLNTAVRSADAPPAETVFWKDASRAAECGSRKKRTAGTSERRVPQEIPGYEFERFLGAGSYGEVWIAVQVNTMRRVAVKFYTHETQNIESLTQEVEKLSLLFSDQNIVQLLEVGWEARVPYYVMEYLENGSLAQLLSQKKFSIAEAEEMFETLLRAMCRVHEKGIIHCDLKPGNILIDPTGNVRLADFGQSRLSHDMAPALGTLFYMPPEQARLNAHADVRWDIYALGAIFYTLLMNRPPHYAPIFVEQIQEQETLTERMRDYRRLLFARPVPVDHRQLKGMSLKGAQILERCLEPDPEDRFQTMAELLREWEKVKTQRAQFPLLLLGMVMPILLFLVGSFFVTWEFHSVFHEGERVITDSTLEAADYAAGAVAKNVESEISRRRRVVEQLAENWQFCDLVQELKENAEWNGYIQRLKAMQAAASSKAEGETIVQTRHAEEKSAARPQRLKDEAAVLAQRAEDAPAAQAQWLQLRTEFANFSKRLELQKVLEESLPKDFQVAMGDDFFFVDTNGIACARMPFSEQVGRDFSPHFKVNGKEKDPLLLHETRISDVFLNPLTDRWSVGIIVPVFSAEEEPVFLGLLCMAVEIGNFIQLEGQTDHFAVLVDQREGMSKGLILEHPLYEQLNRAGMAIPESFLEEKFRVTEKIIPDTQEKAHHYRDPLAASKLANGQFQERWLAACADVELGTGEKWLVIAQTSYDHAVGVTFKAIESHFRRVYITAAVTFLILIQIAWFFIHRVFILKANR